MLQRGSRLSNKVVFQPLGRRDSFKEDYEHGQEKEEGRQKEDDQEKGSQEGNQEEGR